MQSKKNIFVQIMERIDRLSISADEKTRLKHYSVFISLGVPAMWAYGVYHLLVRHYVLSAFITFTAIGLLVGFILLFRLQKGRAVYRINIFLYSALMLFLVATGGESGSRILWLYTFPLIALFMLGKREGLFWTTALLLVSAVLLTPVLPAHWVYDYPLKMITRFYVTFVIVAAVASWFEFLRTGYRVKSEQETQKLLRETHRLKDEIQKRKKAERDIRTKQELFDEILTNSRDILYRRKISTSRYDYISEAFGNLLELSPGEVDDLALTGIEDLIHPEDRRLHKAHLEALMTQEMQKPLEYRMRTKSGRYLWFRDQMSVVCDEHGEPAYVVGVNREITLQRETEMAVLDARNRLSSILDSINAHVYVADMKSHVIHFMNEKMKADFGRDLEGKICWKEFRKADGPCSHCTNSRLLDDNDNATGVYEWECFNPVTNRWYNNFDRAIRWVDGTWARIQIAVDITRMKSLEEERRRNEKSLRRARQLEALGTLAGGIAHDFNNLLHIILGNLSLAEAADDGSPKTQKYLQEIKVALDKARELANRLVTFSTGGAPHRVLIPVAPLIDKTVKEVIQDTSVIYEVHIAPGLWPTHIDFGQIAIVLNNVITNACESMTGRGRLIISAENMSGSDRSAQTADGVPPGNYVRIGIQDHGVGIAASELPKVFEPYYSTKAKSVLKGMGLGLAIAYSIIKRHHGHISIKSRVGQGTSVDIYLPAEMEDAEAPIALAASQPEFDCLHTGRILVMDDEPMIRELAMEMFPALGFQVDVARDGQEAIDRYMDRLKSGQRYTLVILDLTVTEGMGGKQAIEQLLRIDPSACAIVSSGYSNDPVIRDHKTLGFIGALEKPYTTRKVKDLLEELQSR